MQSSGKIVCIGQSVMDIVAGNVWKNSFNHERMNIHYVKHLPGGHANNHALCLRKFGKEVVFIGRVGADGHGYKILDSLRSHGVDVSNVMIDPTLETSVSIILVGSDGEKTILQHQTGNNAFTVDMVDVSVLDNASIVCVGSLWALPGLDGDGVAQLFSYAKAHNVITVADTGEDSKYVGIKPIITALQYTDYFFPSNWEVKSITGLDDPALAADALLEMGPSVVVIRLGNAGCLVATKQEKKVVSTITVKPIDSTGACDNFMAGFLTKLSEGADLYECALFANTAGALSTLSIGANTADYTYQTVLERSKNIKL